MTRLVTLAMMLVLVIPLAVRADDRALAPAYLAASDGDWPEALRLFELAAEDDNVLAKETVAFMYLKGGELYPGVERNVALSKAWYYRAEAQGSAVASRMLAFLESTPSGAMAAVPEPSLAR